MSEAPEHVCLYVSLKPTKSACFGVCQIPYEKRSVFDHQFNFLRFVRGGTSRSLARRQTCMYVCMFELQTYPKHVCMYVCMYVWQAQASMYVCLRPSEHVCMYVCPRQLSVYVCMSETPEQVCMYVSSNWACMYVMCWACMYVSSMYVCLRERRFMYVWMSQTYIHSQARWACMFGMLIFERVCMFQNPVFCHTFCSSNLTPN